MTPKQSTNGNSWLFNPLPADLSATAKKRMEEFSSAQGDLFENVQDFNQQWLTRIETEAKVASEFASRLAAAKSVPDAMSAYQQWGSRHLEMMAEDGVHFMENAHKVIQLGAHLLTTGWLSGNSDARK